MSTLTKETKTEDKIVKSNSTSSHKLLRSAKESTIISNIKNNVTDDDHFVERVGNPWSGFMKKPLLNRRQNDSNKVKILKVESFVDRVSKQSFQGNQKNSNQNLIQIPVDNAKR